MSTRTTTPLTRFWLALEQVPGAAAVGAEWRRRLGADFERTRALFPPDPELAASYPRLSAPGVPYRVVAHGPNDFVGVGDDGDTVPLSRADLVVYRLALAELVRRVAGAFGFDPDVRGVEGLGGTSHVGSFRPLAGFAFPVYLTVQLEPADYNGAAAGLLARTAGPFVLLAPTNRHHRGAAQALLDARGAAFVPLADAIRLGESGQWERTDAAHKWLGEFCARVLPAAEPIRAGVFFPTPPAARWADVRIRFLDGDRVAVAVGAVTRTLTYAQMGMADGRNARCTKRWELLRAFAAARGELTWRAGGSARKNQKRCQELANDLRAFFRIDGEPITLTEDRKGWRTAFVLEPD